MVLTERDQERGRKGGSIMGAGILIARNSTVRAPGAQVRCIVRCKD